MECCRVREMLSALVDGALGEQSLELVESHLHGCAECSREMTAIRSLVMVAHEVEEIEPPAGLRQQIRMAVRDTERSCSAVMEQISAYVDGEVSPGQRSAVGAHIEACEACAEEVEALKALAGAASAITQIEPPSDLRARIAAATTGAQRRERSAGFLQGLISTCGMQWVGGTAAAAILAIVVSTWHTPSIVKQAQVRSHSPVESVARLLPTAPSPPSSVKVAVTHPVSPVGTLTVRAHRRHQIRHETVRLVATVPMVKSTSVRPTVRSLDKINDQAAPNNDASVEEVRPARLAAAEPTVTVASAPAPDVPKKKDRNELVKVAVANLMTTQRTEEWLRGAKAQALRHRGGDVQVSVLSMKF